MKESPQGERWRRLDNTAKIFPVIANENLSNVYRLSATLDQAVVPGRLQRALEEVLPQFEGFRVKLRRGFFWYYFETNKRMPVIERETTYPCKYIDPHSNQMFLFRVSYYECRINLEVFHAVTDGLGAVNFLKAIVYRYLDLTRDDHTGHSFSQRIPSDVSMNVEDSYVRNYKETKKRKYNTRKAFHLSGKELPLDQESVVHGYVNLKELKQAGKAYGVSITKFLVAALIYSIYREYKDEIPEGQMIGISLPINLRAFFGSETMSNFFAVTLIEFLSTGNDHTFEEVVSHVDKQMTENITKEKLEETISYNVSNEKKWYLRIAPLFLKWAGMNAVFWRNDRGYTMTLSNIGPICVEKEYEEQIKQFHLMIGVAKRQPVKCAVCSYKDQVVVTFTSVFADRRLQDAFFGFLREAGVAVETESNGVPEGSGLLEGSGLTESNRMPESGGRSESNRVPKDSGQTENSAPPSSRDDKGMYPKIAYDPKRWKEIVNTFYGILFAVAAILGVVNYTTYSGSLWSVIAIACIAYVALTVKYSLTRHANLAFKVVIQTTAFMVLLAAIDYGSGYSGWSVNYGIPSTILFADLAVVFLILVNRLNWQSYFMYQIAITIFSFIPLVLWAAGLIHRPLLSVVTVLVTVCILAVIVVKGDRSVKTELKRRFHL